MKRFDYSIIDSTNEEGKRKIIAGETGDFLLVAKEQSNGKGRKGREFFSPKDTGIYMTYVHVGNENINEMLKITCATAVIVRDSIASIYNIDCSIKWVNDLYLNNRKVCGILCECILPTKEREEYGFVVGIGINISTNEFPDDIADKAGSICINDDSNMKDKLIDSICKGLKEFFDMPEQFEFIEEYKKHSMCINKEVELIDALGEQRKAYVCDISNEGHLIVKNPDGREEEISTGEISLKIS